MPRYLQLPLLLLLLGACGVEAAPTPATPVVQADAAPEAPAAPSPALPGSAERPDPDGPFNLPYVERELGSEAPVKPWLLMLHGLGSTAERFVGVMDHHRQPLHLVSAQATTAWGQGWSWFTFRDGSPEERTASYLAAVDQVAAFIEAWGAAHPDYGKPVVMGFSQGGMLSFGLAVRHPQAIAMAIPVAGMLPDPALLQGREFPGPLPPVRALHGLGDERVPPQNAEATVKAMSSVGFDATLETWPGVGHAMTADMRQAVSRLVIESAAAPGGPREPAPAAAD